MKLLILGATGGTGLEVVRQAIEQRHSVTAFVRSPERLKPFGDRVNIIKGDLLNSSEMGRAIQAQDAILSGFGPRYPLAKSDVGLLRRFAVVLTDAMQRVGTRRVIVESVAFLFKNSIIPPAYLFGRLFFPEQVADAAGMEGVFRATRLDWTLVRPPQLTDKPRTGKYRVQAYHLPLFGFNISRADVADFMIRAAENRTLISKIIGISN